MKGSEIKSNYEKKLDIGKRYFKVLNRVPSSQIEISKMLNTVTYILIYRRWIKHFTTS